MPVARELIQPSGEKLIDYAGFVGKLQALSASPRVKLELLDTTAEGRGIWAVVIADADVLPISRYHEAIAAQRQRPNVKHATASQTDVSTRPAAPADLHYTAAVIGQSFGHEASHVEALVELCEKLAWSDDAEVRAILAKLIVVVVPMMNPDGRELGVELWKRVPLAEDGAVAGTRYGFYVNRDFLHLTQPEGRAILKLFRDWHPLSLYDTHEDAYLLYVSTPEVCWFPEDGLATADLAPRNIQEIVSKLGAGIKTAWTARGYNFYPKDMFAYPMLGMRLDEPHRISTGNITGSMSLHGTPSLITESSRTPGAQTWEDRIGQKVSAGIAVLDVTAREADAIADTIYSNAVAAILGDGAFTLPKAQPELGALNELINVLLKHEIAVYETDDAFIVPSSQPKAPLIASLLGNGQLSRLVAMPPAMGLQARPSTDAEKSAPLRPVFTPAFPSLHLRGTIGELVSVAIPNTLDGVRLINRLWHTGAQIAWLAAPLTTAGAMHDIGTFIVRDIPTRTLKAQAAGLPVEAGTLPAGIKAQARLLKKPGLNLYVGQGVDRPTPSPMGDIWWGLENYGFDLSLLEAEAVTPEILARGDLLIVPEGVAGDIVEGWHLNNRRSNGAWDMPGTPRGIGDAGLKAVRSFVEGGGSYLGFGTGGGLLASPEYLNMVDVSVLHHSLGSARINLRIAQPENPLAYGLRGSYDAAGQWQPGIVPAIYDTETMSNKVSGPVFKAGPKAQAVALYHSADVEPGQLYLIHTELFDERENGVAVAAQSVGKGLATVIGVRPGFRAFWPYSFKLVTNAAFLSGAGGVETVTL